MMLGSAASTSEHQGWPVEGRIDEIKAMKSGAWPASGKARCCAEAGILKFRKIAMSARNSGGGGVGWGWGLPSSLGDCSWVSRSNDMVPFSRRISSYTSPKSASNTGRWRNDRTTLCLDYGSLSRTVHRKKT